MISFGRSFKEARTLQGFTQSELSARSGVSLPAIQIIERGDGNPSAETLSRLSDALGLVLELRAKNADWDLLALCGAPLTQITPRPSIRASRRLLRDQVLLAAAELSIKSPIPDRERKMEALQAVLVALRDHYPAIFKSEFSKAELVQKLMPKDLSGRIVRLRRLALANLAEYL